MRLVCQLFFFFYKYTATTDIYTYWHTRSLHDALPISETFSGNVTIGDDGKGVITITPAEDNVTEAAQTLTVTVGDQTASVTVTDPAAQDQVLTQNQASPVFWVTPGAIPFKDVANGSSLLVPGTLPVVDHITANAHTEIGGANC